MSKGYQAYADALANSEPTGENAAVLQHIGLVHKTALHIKARLPDHVELEELVQIGMVGLLEAAKSYDASQGADLGTFASKRIRGAILDEVRKRSPLSRTDSSHIKAEQQVIEQFLAKHMAATLPQAKWPASLIPPLTNIKSNEIDRTSFGQLPSMSWRRAANRHYQRPQALKTR